jgi:hypothetical protein
MVWASLSGLSLALLISYYSHSPTVVTLPPSISDTVLSHQGFKVSDFYYTTTTSSGNTEIPCKVKSSFVFGVHNLILRD